VNRQAGGDMGLFSADFKGLIEGYILPMDTFCRLWMQHLGCFEV
jgi:hypothetical protein